LRGFGELWEWSTEFDFVNVNRALANFYSYDVCGRQEFRGLIWAWNRARPRGFRRHQTARRSIKEIFLSERDGYKREANEMATNTAKKCAHPNCSCLADADSKYCSAACAAVENMPDIDCRCGHPGCKGKAH
jgi:hypothetical protein